MLRFAPVSADKEGMSLRFPALLPRVAVIAAVALGTTATLTYAAGEGINTASTPTTADAPVVRSIIAVPDVQNQAFVFAKGGLEDAGFAWKVTGAVHGYSSNTVVSQNPRPGTKVFDTGAPLVTLSLARNTRYPEVGAADDRAPYAATAVEPVNGPAFPAAPKKKAPAATTPAATTPATTAATTTTAAATTATTATTTTATTTGARATAAAPAAAAQSRTPDFIVPGAKKEPADEIPLTVRASQLDAWLTKHPKLTNTNAKYWLYQHSWIVTGARLGWWHGADALRALIAVDKRVQSMWGMGAKSQAAATAALSYVEAKAKK
jgi:hypothetical protein